MFINPITSNYYKITSKYNLNRTINGITRPHRAIDIATPTGTALKSPVFGEVIKVGRSPDAGNYIKIKDNLGRIFLFAHLSQVKVNEKQKLIPNQVIGSSGNTGNTTGPHLHFAITSRKGEKIDPEQIYKLSYGNKYFVLLSIASIFTIYQYKKYL